jgi:hypothetical protein
LIKKSAVPFYLRFLDFKGFWAFRPMNQPALESFSGRVFLFSVVAANCLKCKGLLCRVSVCFLSKGWLYGVIVCF